MWGSGRGPRTARRAPRSRAEGPGVPRIGGPGRGGRPGDHRPSLPGGVGGRGYHGRTMEAAFFDLDKTIISRSSSLALSRPMYRAGMVSRGALLRGAYAQLVYLLVGADEEK